MSLKPSKKLTNRVKCKHNKLSSTDVTKKNSILIDENLVCQYLVDHPDFFIRHSKQIEMINIPHPIRGVISLPEWQLVRQRAKIKELENEISFLMGQANHNEILLESLMVLQNELLRAEDPHDLLVRLNQWAKSLGLIGAYLYLFEDKWQIDTPSIYHDLALSADKFEFIRIRHLQYSFQYLGQLNTTELALLIADKCYVGSVAISLLGEFGDLGVLVFASRSQDHYQQGQGTFLLDKMNQILPILIGRWIMRKR